ncbi:MAG: DUF1800 domain-containing protein [Hyphomonadaceae bacterium]|nr:DUF1800 domain-containing protein [Hyphomonadaceae bacterium]
MLRLFKRQIIVAALAGLLAACGGGGGGGGDSGSGGGGVVVGGGGAGSGGGGTGAGGGTGGGGTGGGATSGAPPTTAEAARLLTQATFGPTDAAIQEVVSSGSINAWVTAQIAKPVASNAHLDYIESIWKAGAGFFPSRNDFYSTWWRSAINGEDQLRQRVAFALSQIFVVSIVDDNVDTWGAASYYDMLTRNAFGNFRTLLEDVTMHPMMGVYLTFMANQKEDGTRSPDENYAREVMQLMTIGLYELNADGTQRLNNGQPIPTYTSADIRGLAKVFTGISWYHPQPSNGSFYNGTRSDARTTTPMIFYPTFHSTSEKTFLGTTIPASPTVNIGSEIDIALDRLFNHPNTGPFISRRLIQQLVTSNPSPEYVGRVAAVFANNGAGVRGDIAAVVRAILTDTEARSTTAAVSSSSFGKFREPVIRITNWARAFGATSQSGKYVFVSTASNIDLSQAPLTSPSVFNFWRPGYTPPNSTQLGQHNLVAPEFQIIDEVTAPAYVNLIQETVQNGIGWAAEGFTGHDVRAAYSAEIAIADNASALVDRLNRLLFYGQMSTTLRDRIIAGVNAVPIPAVTGSNQAAIDSAKLTRARTAIFFAMISPEYLVQR